MSKETLLYIILFYISFFCATIKSQSSQVIIREIYPYYYNTTATFISLINTNIRKYAYFSFDLTHIKSKDIAYFKITTDFALYHSNIQYYFFDKKIDTISSYDVERRNIYWYYMKGSNFRKEKTEQGYDTYINIENLSKYNRKTLLIRIDVEKLKGDISIENLESIPEENDLIKNNYSKNNYGFKNYDKQNQHLHGVINNEKRYYNNDNYNKYYHYHKEWRYHSHDRINEYNSLKVVYGLILFNIWFIIILLYCLINRKKRNNQIIVAINNNV